MLSALQQAVTEPATFFDRESRDPGLLRPALVVAGVALVGLLGSVPTFLAVSEALPEGAGVFAAVGLAIGAVTSLVVPFVVWLVFAVLFFVGTVLVDGTGEFRDLFALVGWGFAPRVIATLVGAVVSFVVLGNVDLSDPQQAQQIGQMVATSPLGIVNQIVGVLTYVWAGWIWTHAVANARDVSVQNAGTVVGIVVLLAVLANVVPTYLL